MRLRTAILIAAGFFAASLLLFVVAIAALFMVGDRIPLVRDWRDSRVAGWHGPRTEHFDGEAFQNMDPLRMKSLREIFKWRLTTHREPWPEWIASRPGVTPPPLVQGDEFELTFINHAGFLIQTGGANLLTDPIWSERASPVQWFGPRRVREAGLAFEQLPKIDAVLLSHNHYDHMDLQTLRRLDAAFKPVFIAGLGNAEFLRARGLRDVIELDWWQGTSVRNLNITFTPARHFSRRGFGDGMKTLWGGFMIENAGRRLFFAGDTGYGRHFTMIRERLGAPVAALLPIGAYLPRDIMGPVHLDPADAVKAHRDLGAKTSVGMHFGTFRLTDEVIDAPAGDLAAAREAAGLDDADFIVPEFGGRYVF